MKTLILLMQMFGTFGYDVCIMQHEPDMVLAGCDQHYDKGLTLTSCINNVDKRLTIYLGTDATFWQLEAVKEITFQKERLGK